MMTYSATYIKLSFCLTFVFSLFLISVSGQETIDKTVATVSDGTRTELITLSDLHWQIALVPNLLINPPTSEDLNRALQAIIRQRLIALEAKRLPREEPKKEEIDNEIKRVLNLFSTTGEFIKRLQTVGFDSVQDENFQRMMKQRVSIEKYVDFRFRSFVVITPEDEKTYYRNVFTPDFRKQNKGRLLPSLDQMRERINEILTEQKVQSNIETFLDNARNRAEVNIISAV